MVGQARILSPKEIKNIFQLLPTARDKAMFAIGIYTGLRVGELVALRADQLFTESGNVRSILKVKRKKKKNVVYSDIPMHEKLKKILADYHEPGQFGKWLFPSEASASGHLTRAAAHNILAKAWDGHRDTAQTWQNHAFVKLSYGLGELFGFMWLVRVFQQALLG